MTWSTGSSSFTPPALALRQDVLGQIHLVLLDQRLAGGHALGAVERVGHGAADDQRVDLVSRFVITLTLSLTLAPPRMATNGRSGLRQRAAEVVDLLLHQEAGDVLLVELADDARSRRGRGARSRRRR